MIEHKNNVIYRIQIPVSRDVFTDFQVIDFQMSRDVFIRLSRVRSRGHSSADAGDWLTKMMLDDDDRILDADTWTQKDVFSRVMQRDVF